MSRARFAAAVLNHLNLRLGPAVTACLVFGPSSQCRVNVVGAEQGDQAADDG